MVAYSLFLEVMTSTITQKETTEAREASNLSRMSNITKSKVAVFKPLKKHVDVTVREVLVSLRDDMLPRYKKAKEY